MDNLSSKFKLTDRHIYQLVVQIGDFQPGFYFEDETNNFNGPFASKEEAKLALITYCRFL